MQHVRQESQQRFNKQGFVGVAHVNHRFIQAIVL